MNNDNQQVVHWDAVYDVVVVGSGAGAMTAALRAHDQGLSVLMVEKAAEYGGTTAISGGGIWIPCNDQIEALGGNDSREQAQAYLRATVGEDYDPARMDAYLEHCGRSSGAAGADRAGGAGGGAGFAVGLEDMLLGVY